MWNRRQLLIGMGVVGATHQLGFPAVAHASAPPSQSTIDQFTGTFNLTPPGPQIQAVESQVQALLQAMPTISGQLSAEWLGERLVPESFIGISIIGTVLQLQDGQEPPVSAEYDGSVGTLWDDETGYPNLVRTILSDEGLYVVTTGRLNRFAHYYFTGPHDMIVRSRVSGDRFDPVEIDLTYQRAP